MFTPEALLAAHRWTHSSLRALLRHCVTLTSDELTRPVEGFGYVTVWEQLCHLIGCEDAWLTDLTGESLAGSEPDLRRGVAALSDLRDVVAARTRAYIAGRSGSDLNTVMTIASPDGRTIERTPAFILMHVLTHSYHHKGQVVAMCRLLGRPAPDTDMQRADAEPD